MVEVEDAVAMTKIEETNSQPSFFLINAGHPRALFLGYQSVPEDRLIGRWLVGVVALFACTGGLLFLIANGSSARPLETTIQLERLAKKLEAVGALPAETSDELKLLLGQRWYNCEQVACSPELQTRNHAARDRLLSLIAAKDPTLLIGSIARPAERKLRQEADALPR